MLRSWKRVWAACAAIAMIAATFPGSTVLAAETAKRLQVAVAPISFQFDAVPLAPPTGDEGFIVNGTTYVPLRFMSYAVEKSVRWDSATSTVFVSEPSRFELVTIRENNLNRVVRGGEETLNKTAVMKTITVYERAVTYIFDGKAKLPSADKPGLIYNNKLYVPLRFFGESVGRTIDWNAASYSIAVRTPSSQQSAAGAGGTSPSKPGASSGSGQSSSGGTQNNGGNAGGVFVPTGGGAPKPSYESLIAAAEQEITALRNNCQTRLSALADLFFETEGWNAQKEVLAQGEAELAACDASFDGIMNSLASKLSSNGYLTSVIEQYRSQYEQLKQAEINRLLGQL